MQCGRAWNRERVLVKRHYRSTARTEDLDGRYTITRIESDLNSAPAPNGISRQSTPAAALPELIRRYVERDGRSLNELAFAAVIDVAYLWRLRAGQRRQQAATCSFVWGWPFGLSPRSSINSSWPQISLQSRTGTCRCPRTSRLRKVYFLVPTLRGTPAPDHAGKHYASEHGSFGFDRTQQVVRQIEVVISHDI
jgi:hypothetical protein